MIELYFRGEYFGISIDGLGNDGFFDDIFFDSFDDLVFFSIINFI